MTKEKIKELHDLEFCLLDVMLFKERIKAAMELQPIRIVLSLQGNGSEVGTQQPIQSLQLGSQRDGDNKLYSKTEAIFNDIIGYIDQRILDVEKQIEEL